MKLDLLLPSADTDRQIRVNLPDGVSPDPSLPPARARAIEDVSQRSSATAATMTVRVAVTDSAYFSTATLSGWMSALLMTVVLVFFICQNFLGITGNQISAEVLALVLTLFSAIQAGRIERPDRSTHPVTSSTPGWEQIDFPKVGS